jgi:polar amino acid transport system substrate-binding protein
MKSAAYFLIISLLGASLTLQAQCLKTISLPNEKLLQTNSKNQLLINKDLKLLQKALAKLDCQVKFVKMPWARSIVELENGRVDILDGAYKTAQRQRFAWYSDFVSDSYSVLFMRKKDFKKHPISSLQDITKHQLRIGTQFSAVYSDEFNQLLADKNFATLIHPNTSRTALWNMLKIGRIDGFISELSQGQNELESINLTTQIGPTDFVVSTQPMHYIFSKKSINVDFVKAVDRELRKLSRLEVE